MRTQPKLCLYIRFKAYHPSYINRLLKLISQELSLWGLPQHNTVFLPKRVERFTVLRSPHVDKKARDQFERVTHKRLLVVTLSGKESFLVYRLLRFISFAAVGVEVRVRYVTKFMPVTDLTAGLLAN